MPPLNLTITFFGRPVKPVALGMLMLLAIVTVGNALGLEGMVHPVRPLNIGLAVMAAAGTLLFIVAWVLNSQRLVEYGLLVAFAIHVIRGSFLAFTDGLDHVSAWQSLAVAAIAAGSYFLERQSVWPTAAGGRHG